MTQRVRRAERLKRRRGFVYERTCPYCMKSGGVPDRRQFAPHPDCEAREWRPLDLFSRAEGRSSGVQWVDWTDSRGERHVDYAFVSLEAKPCPDAALALSDMVKREVSNG